MRYLVACILALSCLTHVNAQLSFSDEAAGLGISVSYGDSEYGGGVSFVDFDGDGWDDLSFTSEDGQDLYFFKNNNGTFTATTFPGVSHTGKTKQIQWIDYDNDGDKDLFVTAIIGANKFFRNDGGMNFTDISATIGFFQDDKDTYGASFGDIDNDGDLDAFISNRDGTVQTQHNYLYRNDNGTFVDITSAAGIVMTNEITFCSVFFDYNNDNFQDIYVANDKSTNPNRLYKNNGDGTFDDVSAASGAGISIDAMTTTVGDYDNDGDFDIYVTNTPNGGNYLLQNQGDGTFVDVADATGTRMNSFAWGASFLDADHDGFIDLFVSSSMDGSVSTFLSSAFYHQQSGTNNFSIPSNIGFQNDEYESYSNAVGDIDNDGRPDLVVSNDTDTNNLWHNMSTNSNNWLKIKLEGVVSNKDGVGNMIEIRANGTSQYRYTHAGEGYLGQYSSYEFVGVGNATTIEYVKITWKATSQIETINNVAVNQAITVQEGNGILSTSTQELTNVSIFPNPSSNGIFQIYAPSLSTYTVKVFDLSGRTVVDQKDQPVIDLANLSSGIYLAKVTSDQGSKTFKLIHR
jgi:hypothetical protein